MLWHEKLSDKISMQQYYLMEPDDNNIITRMLEITTVKGKSIH